MISDLNNLQSHPFADVFPMYGGKELQELAQDILENGLLEKVILFAGRILDGRNRYAALKLAAIPLEHEQHFSYFDGTEAEALRLASALNLRRRHLTTTQRGMIASTIATVLHGGSGRRIDDHVDGVTRSEAAAAMRVSPFMVRAARAVRRAATPRIVDMCERGEVTLAAAELVATLGAAEQAKLVTPALVNTAAAKLRRSKRTFAAFSERRILATIGDLGQELQVRGIDAFVREAEYASLTQIDATIGLLDDLRKAIVTNGSMAPAPI